MNQRERNPGFSLASTQQRVRTGVSNTTANSCRADLPGNETSCPGTREGRILSAGIYWSLLNLSSIPDHLFFQVPHFERSILSDHMWGLD